jgi:hypothetical protein
MGEGGAREAEFRNGMLESMRIIHAFLRASRIATCLFAST